MRKILLTSLAILSFFSAHARSENVLASHPSVLIDGRFGKVELSETTSNGMVTEVAFYTPQIVNVRHYQENSAVQKKNLVVTLAKQDVAVSVDAISDHEIALSSNQLRVIYNKETGNVAFYDLQGNQLLKEKEGRTVLTQREDGTEDSYSVKQTFSLQSGEKLYGLGQLQNGNWNQRGKTYDYMIEGNTSVWIPYLHSSMGYALYWDNASPTSYKDNNTGMSFESAVGYGVDYFFLQGSPTDGQEAVCQMRQLTGQVPMIPLWAYGFFQSKERYQSADETMSVVNRYRRLGVPLDCVVQDWQYWGDNAHWNAMSFLNPKFSNYQEMIDSVHNMNAHILISSWANFGPSTQPYAYFKEHNELMKQGDNIMTDTYPSNEGVAIYDAYNEDARNHYWQFLYDGVVSKGIDAYWLDSSEPDHYQGGTQMEQTFDFETGMGCTWRSVRNAFPLVHVGGVYDHHRAEPNLSSKRCMILTRSGYAGLQRYGANTWSGDITASWQTLANQIPAALSYSVCGLPNWNSDTGAFFNGDLQGPGNDEYNELYARWFQFSTFCPMMRSHGAGTDKAIYVWGKQGNPYFDNEERYIHLRYALLPYIYSTAWNVHQQGLSFMNPMALMFPEDSKTHLLKNQYMFGQSFIVAPVLRYKATQRSVYLPAGSKWVDFWTGEQMDGGQGMTKKFDLQTLPLYVRAGSIVPFALPAQTAKVSDWDTLQVRIYPGADGNFELYEDEGDNYNYEKGQYSTISFHWDDANGRLTIGHREGTFKGMLTKRVFDVVVVGEEMGTGNELSSSIHKRVEYDGSEVSVDIDLAKTEEVSYGRGETSQDATDVELSLDDFNAKINGNGTFANNTFTPVAKGFGGWWNSNGIAVAHHRYMVVELEEPSAKEMALRIYPKDEYNSAPLSAHFSAGKTKMAIETGDHSFIYGAGIWSKSRQAIKLHRVYFTNTLSEDVATDESSPYTFVPADWQTGDGSRVNQRNISYDADKGAILVKASGEQNTCLQLAASKSDLYKFSNQKKFFCVKASNVSSVQNNAQLWFMLGNHVGVVTPSKVFASADGDIVTAWDISTWMPKSEQVHLCYGNTFIICFGLTSTTGESLISDINFYEEDELGNIGTGIETPRQEAKKLMDPAIYDLQGRKLQGKPQPGFYICNGKKFIIK